jgi:hypothetical protein
MPDDRITKLVDGERTGLKGRIGGRRKGAGRRRGTIRRLSEEAIREALAQGQMLPLDYMMSVLNDPAASADRRDMMAVAAAPYFHARLTSTVIARAGLGPVLDAEAPLVGSLVVTVGGEGNGAAASAIDESVTITPPLSVEAPVVENLDRLLTCDDDPQGSRPPADPSVP